MPSQSNPWQWYQKQNNAEFQIPGIGGGPVITTSGTPGTPGVSGTTGSTAALANLVNSLNQTNQQQALANRIPQNPALEAKSSANIGQALAGQLPTDVINLLGQQSAERGVMTGMPSSPASNAAYLKALGLTSLGQMNTGQQWLSAADARNPIAPVTDAMDVYKTLANQELAYNQLANQRYIADQENATRQMLGRTGTTGTAKAATPFVPPPQFDTYPGSNGNQATMTGTTTSNDIWDPLMWDYFPELMYQGDLGTSQSGIGDMMWSPSNTSFGLGLDEYMTPQDQSNQYNWETWGDTWF